jgi:HK97 gp10 family phage protein
MADGIRVEGVKGVQKFLQDLDVRIQDKAMRASLRAGGKVFQAAIQERAPERVEDGGNSLPVGALAADITLKVGRDEEGTLSAVVSPGKRTAHVAGWVEYGHRLVRGGYAKFNKAGKKIRGPGAQVGTVPEHPFIRPAFEASVEAAELAFAEELSNQIAKRS